MKHPAVSLQSVWSQSTCAALVRQKDSSFKAMWKGVNRQLWWYRSLLSSVLINPSLVGVTVAQTCPVSLEELVQNLVPYRLTGRGGTQVCFVFAICVKEFWHFFFLS